MKSKCLKLIYLGLSLLLTTGCPRPVTNYDTHIYNQSDSGGTKAQSEGGGTINGGGGKGVRCTKNGHTTLEVLDLYEAKAIYNLTPLDLGNDEAKARTTLVKIVARHTHGPGNIPLDDYAKALEDYVFKEFIEKKIQFIDPPKTLKPVQDTFEPLLEKGCELVQIAIFYDESALMIDRALWNQLNVTNRMALMAHEFVYASIRSEGVTNSVSSRKLVAHLLSQEGIPPLLDGIPESEFPNAFKCTMELDSIRVGNFYMFAKKNKEGEDYLHVAFGRSAAMNPNLVKTTTTLKNVDLRELVSQRPYHFRFNSIIDTDGYSNLNGDVSFQFLGTDSRHRSNLNGFLVAIPSGKSSAPVQINFGCEVPDQLDQILPNVGLPEGKYHSKKLIRGIYRDTIEVDRLGGLEIIHEGDFTDPQGNQRTCSWSEFGIATHRQEDSLTYRLESVELHSRSDDGSICSSEFESLSQSLKSAEGGGGYTLDLQEFEPVGSAQPN